jgi:hypothetical protein
MKADNPAPINERDRLPDERFRSDGLGVKNRATMASATRIQAAESCFVLSSSYGWYRTKFAMTKTTNPGTYLIT